MTPFQKMIKENERRAKEIKAWHRKGMTAIEIARRYSITRQRVYQILAEAK